MEDVYLSDKMIDPVTYCKPYFSRLTDRQLATLIGSIALLRRVDLKILVSLLDMSKIEVEEKVGRLLQTDIFNGEFEGNQFVLNNLNYQFLKQKPNLTIDQRTMLSYLKARFSVTFDELQKAFSLSANSIIFILAEFITKGLITTEIIDNQRIEIVTHYSLPKKSHLKITTLEKQIIGFAILKKITSFKEITSELEIPEHRVQSTIVDFILSDNILCNFYASKNLLKSYGIRIEIKRLLVTFPRRNIDLMAEEEKLLIGYILLRGKIKIKELCNVFEISRKELFGMISSLHSTREVVFKLNNNELEILSEHFVAAIASIESLHSTSMFNYRVLLGILDTEKKVRIANIAKKMNCKFFDVVKGIINLYLNGIIRGVLSDYNTFVLSKIDHRKKIEEHVLESWERIILGVLLLESIISWPKLAALLEVDRDTARGRAYSFISRGITDAIARDSVLSISKKPKIPPLIQISELDQSHQRVLGYILLKRSVKLKEIRTVFRLSSISVYRIIYMIIGSGLVQLQRDKGQLILLQYPNFRPSTAVNDLDNKAQQLISVIEEKVPLLASIDLKTLTTELQMSLNEIILILSQLTANGYYVGTLRGRKYKKDKGLLNVRGKSKCFECGLILPDYSKPCPACSAIPPICSVCRGAISSNDFNGACPYCRQLAHSVHLTEWLKIKSECPICKRKLTIHMVNMKN